MTKTNANLVSIITPAYCASDYISETIESVLRQTYTNWELIIVDDKSNDDTLKVARAYGERDARILVIESLINGGPAAARNIGLSNSRGDWVAFLDSDDLWHPEKLNKTLSFALARSSAFTYTAYRRMSNDGLEIGGIVNVPKSLTYKQLLGNTAIATSTVLINRRIVGSFEMKKTYYDDFVCWLSILKRGYVAYGLDEPLMQYRKTKNSISRNKIKSALKVWSTYRVDLKLNMWESARSFFGYALNALVKYRNY